MSVCLLGSRAPEQPLFLPDLQSPLQLWARVPRARRLIWDSQHSPHPRPKRWGSPPTAPLKPGWALPLEVTKPRVQAERPHRVRSASAELAWEPSGAKAMSYSNFDPGGAYVNMGRKVHQDAFVHFSVK